MNTKILIIVAALFLSQSMYAMDSEPTQEQAAYYGPSDLANNIQWTCLMLNIDRLDLNIAILSDEYVASNDQNHKNDLATKINAEIETLYAAIAEKEALELEDLRQQFIYDCVMDDFRSKQR